MWRCNMDVVFNYVMMHISEVVIYLFMTFFVTIKLQDVICNQEIMVLMKMNLIRKN